MNLYIPLVVCIAALSLLVLIAVNLAFRIFGRKKVFVYGFMLILAALVMAAWVAIF